MNLEKLTADWLAAKAAEDAAKAQRYEIEKSLIALLPAKEEGSISEKVGGHKLTITYKLVRKADTAKLRSAWGELSSDAQSCFKWLAEVSLSDMRRADEESQREAAQYITTGPGKPAIKIEEIKHGN